MAKESAQRHFGTLTAGLDRLGASDVEYSESPYFGDYVVTGRWPGLQLRMVRDRGLERLEVRPPHLSEDEWFDIPLVLTLVIGAEPGETTTLEEQMALLSHHLQEVIGAFQAEEWSRTNLKLEALQRERAARRFGWSRQV